MNAMNIIAWTGGIMLAICAVPQAIKSFIDGHSRGVSYWMLILWGVGEFLLSIYTLHLQEWALLFNYGGNLLVILFITYYKVWPNNDQT